MPERMFSESEVRELLKSVGAQTEPPGEADKIISAVDGIFTDKAENEAFLQHAKAGAREVRDMRRQKAQEGLRQQYQEELAKIPRGRLPQIVELKKKYRQLGLEVY
jgi:hypothetical protein